MGYQPRIRDATLHQTRQGCPDCLPSLPLPPRRAPARGTYHPWAPGQKRPQEHIVHLLPRPVRIPLWRSSRGLPASTAATPRSQESFGPPGCPSCPALGDPHMTCPLALALEPPLPPGTSWMEGQSPGEGDRVLSAPRWATEAAQTHPRQRCLRAHRNLPDELRGLSIPLWRILEAQPPTPPPSHHQEP